MPSWKLVSGLFIGFVGSLVVMVGIGYAMVSIPNENDAAKSQNNVYYWADGTQMVATGTGVNRQNVTIDKIPEAMQWAVISAENKSFYQDSGVDPMGIARALANMARGGQTQGGSTITQQYVKNTYLSQDQTVSRKFKEMFISIKVGTKLDKKQILQGLPEHLVLRPRRLYGIQAAAQTYYGVDAVDLKPSQCAFLAALLKGPTYYDPAGNQDLDKSATPQANEKRSKERWAWILEEDARTSTSPTPSTRKPPRSTPSPRAARRPKGMTGQISYLVDTAKKYVLNHSTITEAQFDQGGYQIYTTFDKKSVNALSAAVKKVQKERLDPKRRDLDAYVQFGAASVLPKDGAIVALYGGEGLRERPLHQQCRHLRCPRRFDVEAVRAGRGDGVRHLQVRRRGHLPAQQVQRQRQAQGEEPGRNVRPEEGRLGLLPAQRGPQALGLHLAAQGHGAVRQHAVRAAGHGRGDVEGPGRREGLRHPRLQLRHAQPVLRHRHLDAERDPYGRRLRDLRCLRQAGRIRTRW